MDNYNQLLQWLVQAELEVTSLEDKEICYTRLESKRFGGMEYVMVFSVQEDNMLIFNLSMATPPVDEYNREAVGHFFARLNADADTGFEWWTSEEGDVNLVYALEFAAVEATDGHLPLFYAILDGMVDEADAQYLDIVNAIVEPTRKGIGNVMNLFQQRGER